MDFVLFEMAKKLKEKGFSEEVIKYYGKHENMFDCNPPLDMNDYGYRYSAPTISQVLKWLRKKKNIHITIDVTNYGFISSTISFKWDKSYCETEIEHYDHKGYSTYEEAALAEIDYVLDNLI